MLGEPAQVRGADAATCLGPAWGRLEASRALRAGEAAQARRKAGHSVSVSSGDKEWNCPRRGGVP